MPVSVPKNLGYDLSRSGKRKCLGLGKDHEFKSRDIVLEQICPACKLKYRYLDSE